MPTVAELGIDRWPVAMRIALVQEILDGVAAEQPPAPLSDANRQLLARRSAQLIANPGIAMTWAQIRAAVEAGQ
jgi:putative addiction module component (TIGR02574 family)